MVFCTEPLIRSEDRGSAAALKSGLGLKHSAGEKGAASDAGVNAGCQRALDLGELKIDALQRR